MVSLALRRGCKVSWIPIEGLTGNLLRSMSTMRPFLWPWGRLEHAKRGVKALAEQFTPATESSISNTLGRCSTVYNNPSYLYR